MDNLALADAQPQHGGWQQPEEPLLTVQGAKPLVFHQGMFPSKVAYREQDQVKLFWDLSYFSDSFRDDCEGGADTSTEVMKLMKKRAIAESCQDELHVRGRIDRLDG